MKNYAVILLIVLCPLFTVEANVFNGYLIEKQKLGKQIEACKLLLEEAETNQSRRQIEKDLKRLDKEYKTVVRKYSDTQILMDQVKKIDPELFESVAIVTKAESNLIHVYVRSVIRSDEEFKYFTNYHFNALAYTCVSPSSENVNVWYSPYGVNTITITIGKCHNEVIARAHEFAHVLYTVPNLKTYSKFLEKINNNRTSKLYGRGHHPCDPSCKAMRSVEERFKNNYVKYLHE